MQHRLVNRETLLTSTNLDGIVFEIHAVFDMTLAMINYFSTVAHHGTRTGLRSK